MICPECGKEFKPNKNQMKGLNRGTTKQVTCSKKCRYIMNSKGYQSHAECDNCHTKFKLGDWQRRRVAEGLKVYCTIACKQTNQALTKRNSSPVIIKTCRWCHAKFTINLKTRSLTRPNVFCSRECTQNMRRLFNKVKTKRKRQHISSLSRGYIVELIGRKIKGGISTEATEDLIEIKRLTIQLQRSMNKCQSKAM